MLQKTDPRTLRLIDAAEFIESLPDDRINTRIWHCGTQACYAGHIILQYGTREQVGKLINRRYTTPAISPRILACEILGICYTDRRATRMFLGGFAGYPVISKQDVA